MPVARKTKSGKWRCQAFDYMEIVGGKKKYHHRSFTASTKYEAERLANEFLRKKSKPSSDLKLSEAMQKYLDIKSNTLSPSTVRGYNSLRRNAYGSLQSKRINQITAEDVQAFVNEYALTHSAKSCSNALGFLTAVISAFIPDAVFHVKIPQKKAVDYYTPSDDDIKRLLDAVKYPPLYRAILLSAFGTLRRSEVCGLKKEDICGDVVTIRRARIETEKGCIVKDFLKNDTSHRQIIYPQFVIDALQECPDEFLVNMTPQRLDVAFSRARNRAGLPYFRFHDLRAYSVSIAHAIGIPDSYLMERGGWKTDHTFKQIYRRTISKENEEISAKLNEHFEKLHS